MNDLYWTREKPSGPGTYHVRWPDLGPDPAGRALVAVAVDGTAVVWCDDRGPTFAQVSLTEWAGPVPDPLDGPAPA